MGIIKFGIVFWLVVSNGVVAYLSARNMKFVDELNRKEALLLFVAGLPFFLAYLFISRILKINGDD